MSAKSNFLKKIVVALFTAAIFAALFARIPLSGVAGALRGAHPGLIAAAAALNFAVLVFGAYKWRLSLLLLGGDISLWETIVLTLGAAPVKMIMPAKSGELVKGLYLSRRGVMRFDRATGSVIFDKALNVMAMLLLFAAGLAISHTGHVSWAALAAALAAMAVLIFWNGFWKRLAVAGARLPEKWASALRQLASSFEEIKPAVKMRLAALSVLFEALGCCVAWLIFRALNIDVPIFVLFIYVPAVILFSHLSVFLMGFGAREAAVVVLFHSYAPEAGLLAAGLVLSAVGFFLVAAAGCAFLPYLISHGAWPGPGGVPGASEIH